MDRTCRYGVRKYTGRCVLTVLLLLTGVFPATADDAQRPCQPHPQGERMPEAELRQMLEEYGYRIRDLSVKDNCYEMQGENPEGEHVRLRMDMQTADVVLSEQGEEPDL